MNVPQDYDDEAERLRTHPLLLPNEDDSTTLSTVDITVLNKTTNKKKLHQMSSSLNEHYLDQMCQE